MPTLSRIPLAEVQRVQPGATTPTLARATDPEALLPDATTTTSSANGWRDMAGSVADPVKCFALVLKGYYLELEVMEPTVDALDLVQWIVVASVLESMNSPNPPPDDDDDDDASSGEEGGSSFGFSAFTSGTAKPSHPKEPKEERKHSLLISMATELDGHAFCPTPEYRTVSGAPLETISAPYSQRQGLVTATTGLPADVVGHLTCHGAEAGPGEVVISKTNQDCGCFFWPLRDDPEKAFFGVFDGHGDLGHHTSNFCMRRVAESIAADPRGLTDPGPALERAFLHADRTLSEQHPDWAGEGGTTATTALMLGRKIWLANCGDSRMVVAKRSGSSGRLTATNLTVDHTAARKEERARVLAAGAFLDPEDESEEPRVWLDRDLSQGIAMTRSLGDSSFSKVGVTAEPEITEYSVSRRDEFLIAATDGIWGVLSSHEAVAIVDGGIKRHPNGHMHAFHAAQELITTAAKKWKKEEGEYRDDVSVHRCCPMSFVLIRSSGLHRSLSSW